MANKRTRRNKMNEALGVNEPETEFQGVEPPVMDLQEHEPNRTHEVKDLPKGAKAYTELIEEDSVYITIIWCPEAGTTVLVHDLKKNHPTVLMRGPTASLKDCLEDVNTFVISKSKAVLSDWQPPENI